VLQHALDQLNHHVGFPLMSMHRQASPRGGTLYLELDDANGRVQIKGEAVTVMNGTLLA
jgi:predicted PhzF superfamily epimerase YddE/YHI9